MKSLIKTSSILLMTSAIAIGAGLSGCGPDRSKSNIAFPSESQATSADAISNGVYRAVQVETSSETEDNGSNVVVNFRHTFKEAGSPKSGDSIEQSMSGFKRERQILSISPGFQIPMTLVRSNDSLGISDVRYYWNTVRSDGTWKWRAYPVSSSSGGLDIAGILTRSPKSDFSARAFYSITSDRQAMLTREGNDVVLYTKWSSSDGVRTVLKVTYRASDTSEFMIKGLALTASAADHLIYSKATEPKTSPEPTPAVPTVPEPSQTSAPISSKPINYDARDQSVRDLKSGSAIVRANGSSTVLQSREEIERFAGQLGFSAPVSNNALEMAAQSGSGVIGIADGRKQLAETISDMISHMKKTMNTNSEDLELVFVIDISGSMSNNIKAVIEELSSIVASFQNIRQSGRSVRIGIVTFGQQDRQQMELDLSSDLATVQTTLSDLYSNYMTRSHSTDPGEACYGGLECAAQKISWAPSNPNRQLIVITDEESYERETGQLGYIKKVEAELQSAKVYPVLVRLKD